MQVLRWMIVIISDLNFSLSRLQRSLLSPSLHMFLMNEFSNLLRMTMTKPSFIEPWHNEDMHSASAKLAEVDTVVDACSNHVVKPKHKPPDGWWTGPFIGCTSLVLIFNPNYYTITPRIIPLGTMVVYSHRTITRKSLHNRTNGITYDWGNGIMVKKKSSVKW